MTGAVKFVLGTLLGSVGVGINGYKGFKKAISAEQARQNIKNKYTSDEWRIYKIAKIEYSGLKNKCINACNKEWLSYNYGNYYENESMWLYDHLKALGIDCPKKITDDIVGLEKQREDRIRFAKWVDSL